MNEKRLAILAVSAMAIPLLMAPPSAFAQANLVRTPISFTLSGCTSLPAGLTVQGSGEDLLVINSRVDRAGNTVIERNDLVTGTATDSNGATYVFSYHSHSTLTVPPGGLPFSVKGTDGFTLVGDGRANQLHVGFVASATVYSLTPFIASFDFVNMRGNPFSCDPI